MRQSQQYDQSITAPRSKATAKQIRAVRGTAVRQLAWCERHDLPLGAERARRRIAWCDEQLATPKQETTP